MVSMRWMVSVSMVVFLAATAAGAQERDELLASPRYEEDARSPAFASLTVEEVTDGITMVSGRSYAYFGFNQPEVRLVLPAADNSVYAVVDFEPPSLVGADGSEVAYELERGIYDHDTHTDEIRFDPETGDGPVDFARAVGVVSVRYPLRLHTLAVRKDGPAVEGLDVTIDGPFVTRRKHGGDDDDPEAASFTGIEAFRALDGEGRVLERAPSTQWSSTGDLTTEVSSYWGEIAEVRLDVVDEWVALRVSYELPSVPPLPEERAGLAPEGGEANPPTPGAKVEVAIAAEPPTEVVAAGLGVTPEKAATRLRELGYPEATGDLMVMSAVQGSLEAVELFLAAGVPIDFVTDDGRTALLSAIMYGHLDVATFLVDAGADVTIADGNNATPLFHAAGKCDATALVRALLAAGADPSRATRGNTTAAEMAGIMGCADNEGVIRAAR